MSIDSDFGEIHLTQYLPNSLVPFPNEQLVGFTVHEYDPRVTLLPSLPSCFIQTTSPRLKPLGQPITETRESGNIQGAQKMMLSPIHFPCICKMHTKFFFYFGSLIGWCFLLSGFYFYYYFLSMQIHLRGAFNHLMPQ